ncbi:MAG: FHA domain-containing protein [Deltaproteobacteria bacterium]|nr:FHA domain-containing protein [Deltaproteobacteria bacterium]
MVKKREKQGSATRIHDRPPGDQEFGYSTTVEIPRNTFSGEIPFEQHSFFEIIIPGENNRVVELEQGEVTIGRSSDCAIHLPVNNVSRIHGRVFFRNEEYSIEDLGSTNGIYVNGVKISKCVLRNNDFVEIGGVKLLFIEEKILKRR